MPQCSWCGRLHDGYGSYCSRKCAYEHCAVDPEGFKANVDQDKSVNGCFLLITLLVVVPVIGGMILFGETGAKVCGGIGVFLSIVVWLSMRGKTAEQASLGTEHPAIQVSVPPVSNIVRFHCPTCAKSLKAPSEKAGIRTRCPKCNSPVTIPGTAVLDSRASMLTPVAAPENVSIPGKVGVAILIGGPCLFMFFTLGGLAIAGPEGILIGGIIGGLGIALLLAMAHINASR